MKKVIVVGTLHENQQAGTAISPFEKRLIYSVESEAVTVIVEEWKIGDHGTVGKRVADAHSLSWCNAGTPDEESMQTHKPYPFWIDDECLTHQAYGPVVAQIKRESYMLDKLFSAMKNHELGLFVCGLAHMHSISEKLYAAGYEVAGYSYCECTSS